MKKFLCVFTGDTEAITAWQALPEEERLQKHEEGIRAWKKWAADHVSHIVNHGGPLGTTTLISRAGISQISNNLAAFLVMEAESQEAAAQLFIKHPHFMIFPGDGVEVMEVLEIPESDE